MDPTLSVEFFTKKFKNSAGSIGLSASFCEIFGAGLLSRSKGLVLLWQGSYSLKMIKLHEFLWPFRVFHDQSLSVCSDSSFKPII